MVGTTLAKLKSGATHIVKSTAHATKKGVVGTAKLAKHVYNEEKDYQSRKRGFTSREHEKQYTSDRAESERELADARRESLEDAESMGQAEGVRAAARFEAMREYSRRDRRSKSTKIVDRASRGVDNFLSIGSGVAYNIAQNDAYERSRPPHPLMQSQGYGGEVSSFNNYLFGGSQQSASSRRRRRR
jgi:hypothetical protein